MSAVVAFPGGTAPAAKAKRLHWSDTPPPNVRWLREPPPPPAKPVATPERLLLAAIVASLKLGQFQAVIDRVRDAPRAMPSARSARYVALEIALGDFAPEPSGGGML